MSEEIFGKVVGPMPVAKFLDKFLPKASPASWTKKMQQVMQSMKSCTSETAMYPICIAALSPSCPGLKLCDVHSTPMQTFEDIKIKPDVSIHNGPSFKEEDLTDIAKPEIIAEFELAKSDDPFLDDNEKEFTSTTNKHRDTLGQITAYATAHLAGQFRTHVFSILVFKDYARLLRWDRSGVIVTGKIQLNEHWLAEFLYRYECATPAERGVDTTVSRPSKVDEDNARGCLGVGDGERFLQLSLDKGDYIVSVPTYMRNQSPTGRSTRSFVAYSLNTRSVVFLKDTWRLVTQKAEHLVYNDLRQANVPHVATCVEAADIQDYVTLTQDFINADWVQHGPKSLRKHRHYRMVLKEVGRDLTSFHSSKELVTAVRDAIVAHKHAFEDAHILHRDISVGNIMITTEGRGLLIDWDLCKYLEDLRRGLPVPSERTGTWQYMAARLLEPPNPGQPPPIPNRADDLESFVHVLNWVTLRCGDHTLEDAVVTTDLTNIYDDSYLDFKGIVRGGRAKILYLGSFSNWARTAGIKNQHLNSLLKDLASTASVRYESPPSETTRALATSLNNAANTTVDGSAEEARFTVNKYDRNLSRLKNSVWMISAFNLALGMHGWPAKDRAINRKLVYKTIPAKRKTESQHGKLRQKQSRSYHDTSADMSDVSEDDEEKEGAVAEDSREPWKANDEI